ISEDMIRMLCSRRESFDDSTIVAFLIRLIKMNNGGISRIIFDSLCLPGGNPLIYQVRFSDRFEDFKKVCDAHFTLEQRLQLDDYLAERTVE
ncbi:hypothetical protein PMAYCL1PPCAC_13201, partial [Pristionchus mayeri]